VRSEEPSLSNRTTNGKIPDLKLQPPSRGRPLGKFPCQPAPGECEAYPLGCGGLEHLGREVLLLPWC